MDAWGTFMWLFHWGKFFLSIYTVSVSACPYGLLSEIMRFKSEKSEKYKIFNSATWSCFTCHVYTSQYNEFTEQSAITFSELHVARRKLYSFPNQAKITWGRIENVQATYLDGSNEEILALRIMCISCNTGIQCTQQGQSLSFLQEGAMGEAALQPDCPPQKR